MFEEIISQLQSMDISYEEMPEQNGLSINVEQMDKMQMIEILNMVNSMGMTVSALDETSMMVTANAAPQPEIEPVAEEGTEEDAAQMAALDEAMSGM